MNNATFDDFLKLDLRVGTVVEAAEFPEARNPAYILRVDFGPDIGIKKSSPDIASNGMQCTPRIVVARRPRDRKPGGPQG